MIRSGVCSFLAFGIISLYGLLSGFGTNLGFAYINFHLPFINRIREAGRHLVLFVVGVSFLSGLGYNFLARIFQQYKQTHQVHPLILPAILLLIFAGVILSETLSIWLQVVADSILDHVVGSDPVRPWPHL